MKWRNTDPLTTVLLGACLTLLISSQLGGCKGGDRPAGPVGETGVAAPAEVKRNEPPPEEIPAKKPEAPPAAPEPAAYFPDAGKERLVDALEIPPIEKGSVILVVIDALNALHLGAYGYERDTSPTIDAMARDGILFTNHVSNSSWTRPSYTTIITGLPKSRHGIELQDKEIPRKIETLAERFKAAGYRTAAFVGNPLVNAFWGHDQGYDVYVDSKTVHQGFPRDEILVDRALKWMERNKDEPFFVTFFLTAPHVPYDPPEEPRRFLKSVPEGEYTQFPFREYKEPLPLEERARIVAAYDDEIAYADGQIARLLAFLEERGLSEKTVLAVTADHGEAFDDHGCYGHTYHQWESVLRVPLLLLSPAAPRGGLYDDRPFTHIDIAPTLLASVGIEPDPQGLPGKSILQVLADPGAGRERVIVSQYDAHGIRRQAIRGRGKKLVHYDKISENSLLRLNNLNKRIERADPMDLPTLVRQLEGEHYELFDMRVDPLEKKDLFPSASSSADARALMKTLGPMIPDGKPPAKMSEEMIEALENAGYFVPENP